jgi:hypothetical protein
MNASRTFGRKGFIKSVNKNVFVRRVSVFLGRSYHSDLHWYV